MKNNKPTILIGIPAYNEAENIEKLIKSILSQIKENYTLKQIIIVSDCSNDNTDQIVKNIRNEKVKLLRNKDRSGKYFSQNRLINILREEILVLLDADIKLKDNHVIEKLIEPLTKDPQIGLVAGNSIPLPGKTLTEKVLNHSIRMKTEIYEQINHKNNIYLCRGTIRAFSKKFISQFKWQSVAGEDAYAYLSCITKGFKFKYEPKAIVYFRSPNNLKDHLRQSTRFLQGYDLLKEYFDHTFINKELRIPLDKIANTTIKYFIINPYYFSIYISILVYSKIKSQFTQNSSHTWNIAISSKKI